MPESHSFNQDTLYNLLPAIYRLRDAYAGKPLYELIGVIAGQVAVLEENLDQLYDDLFIETCSEWVVPYIGDLIGAREVYSAGPTSYSARAQVANMLASRRRKGTTAVLEQLARDVTSWNAHAVEFFQLLAATQYLNHLRSSVRLTSVKDGGELANLRTPFSQISRTADVRRIATGRGKYNIPNVGIFLWRISAFPARQAEPFPLDARRLLINPLGTSLQLFNLPAAEEQITSLAGFENVPSPIPRRRLDRNKEIYIGADKSLCIFENGQPVSTIQVDVCNLEDGSIAWSNPPGDNCYRIDPESARLVIPPGIVPETIRVSYHYGFSANIGGGEYDREEVRYDPSMLIIQMPNDCDHLQEALNTAGANNVVIQILDNQRYVETLSFNLAPAQQIVLASTDENRPVIQLTDDVTIMTGSQSELTIDGLWMGGGTLHITGNVARLRLRHCTLIPGLAPQVSGPKVAPGLIVDSTDTVLEIDHSIVGSILLAPSARAVIRNSIIDATSSEGVAFAAPDRQSPGGALTIENCTVIGKLSTILLQRASNCIFYANLSPADTWTELVFALRKQEGCVRFSYLPNGSSVPRRYRCQPESEADEGRIRPMFVSLRYGDAGYCQLIPLLPQEIWQGAEDEAEMGAFHDLFQPQRLISLQVRLDEYLRFGLEAGIFFAS
jgi:hypothetical protein